MADLRWKMSDIRRPLQVGCYFNRWVSGGRARLVASSIPRDLMGRKYLKSMVSPQSFASLDMQCLFRLGKTNHVFHIGEIRLYVVTLKTILHQSAIPPLCRREISHALDK